MSDESLLKMVTKTVSHSVLKSGELISMVFVNFPVPGGEHIVKVSRSIYCDFSRDRTSEELAAPDILTREIRYALQHGSDVGEFVFQEDEDGSRICIGKAMIFLDRTRMAFPIIKESDGVKYLDCVARIDE